MRTDRAGYILTGLDLLDVGQRPENWLLERDPLALKKEVEAQVARYPGRVTFARIPRERNGVADELAKDGARASKALSADRRR